MTTQTPVRQGDVWLERVDTLPAGLVPANRDEHGRIVLALGEVSGHGHCIRDKHVTAFRIDGARVDPLQADIDYIEVGGSGATLAHEYVSGAEADHKPVSLAPGIYKIVGQRSYSPQRIKRVID